LQSEQVTKLLFWL